MQLVQGYSPLQAGLRTKPFAVVTGVFSPLSNRDHAPGRQARRWWPFGWPRERGFRRWPPRSRRDSAYFGPVLASMVVMAAAWA